MRAQVLTSGLTPAKKMTLVSLDVRVTVTKITKNGPFLRMVHSWSFI